MKERSPLLKRLLASLIGIALPLLFLEALARTVWTIDYDVGRSGSNSQNDPFVYSSEIGWKNKPGFKGTISGVYREYDRAGYLDIDTQKVAGPKRKKKVVFVGDSCTFGFAVDEKEAFPEVVEAILPDIDAINLGVLGYSSYQGRVIVQRLLPILKPDVVVISFNCNDRRYVLGPDEPDSQRQFERVFLAFQHWGRGQLTLLESSYLYRGIRFTLIKTGLLMPPMAPINSVRVDGLKVRVKEDDYRKNLSWIAEETKRTGARVIFLLLKDNPIQTEPFKNSLEHRLRSEHKLAVAYLRPLLFDPVFSDLARIELAQIYREMGDAGAAERIIVSHSPFRSLHGGRPIRFDSTYNNIMRQVAQEEDVLLVDAASMLDKHPEDYIDNCHFSADGHRRVAQLLANSISKILGVGTKADH